MKILAIDTATEACSAALLIDGQVSSHYQLAPREHSRLILKMIDDLLLQADVAISQIDAIAFGRGPGSFMGVRIAAGVVQGIAFAHDIPVIPVSTLKAIAQRAHIETQSSHILVAIDARMDEVYWAQYSLDNDQWQLEGEELVISPDNIDLTSILSAEDECWTGAGTGWGSFAQRLLATDDSNRAIKLQAMLPECLPAAEQIVQLAVDDYKAGTMLPAAHAIPVYLRNNVAKKPKPVVL